MIKIANKRSHRPTNTDVPVHRGFPLGNVFDWRGSPKAEFQCKNRAEAIQLYEVWLDKKIEEKDPEVCAELNKIYKLAKNGDVALVCYCEHSSGKEDCHGRIIKARVEEKLNKLK